MLNAMPPIRRPLPKFYIIKMDIFQISDIVCQNKYAMRRYILYIRKKANKLLYFLYLEYTAREIRLYFKRKKRLRTPMRNDLQ